ncbi:hypothetical protein HK103_003771 [Boothiomyces macroporosus]|uniref:Domain of unknown function at the cortex 1 domain-containing protein n=1 Tax=Boothiomyces macroporosus TaxID=261099 RepID=A0AAD5UIB0_9FUNG|nr:hypothetical protein HK103_003771 [Boothiomyces macroporosus]
MSYDPKDYLMRIKVGPDYNNLKTIQVNDEANPIFVNSDTFTGYISVKILNFNGVTPEMDENPSAKLYNSIPKPKSNYFEGRSRKYSITIQGRFKKEWNGDEVLFGADFDKPVTTLPPGISIGLRIAKWLDPAIEADAFAQQPYIYSPIVSSMNALAIYDSNTTELGSSSDFTKSKYSIQLGTSEPLDCKSWHYENIMVPEIPDLLFPDDGQRTAITTYEKRKKHFGNLKNRTSAVISPNNIYCMDFYDAYFDLATCAIKLPGFSLNGLKYWDGQILRYVCKTRDQSVEFFVIQFELMKKTDFGLDASSVPN